jgi:hypothetical protein
MLLFFVIGNLCYKYVEKYTHMIKKIHITAVTYVKSLII